MPTIDPDLARILRNVRDGHGAVLSDWGWLCDEGLASRETPRPGQWQFSLNERGQVMAADLSGQVRGAG